MLMIIELLNLDEFYGESENIDIAKGKYKLELSVMGAWKQYKRAKAWQ